ncbi:MAG: chemotaxis protein CheW [Desulfuromonadales bacterium]|nr:chemotaxis protein CheW [Desulfuromonadales bacterium]MBN2791166.1 chemotaxis protein CheW [Desulfuromonadales bacterium]
MDHNKKLIFQLGRIGFLLDLTHVVEVVDPVQGLFDPGRSDIAQGIVAALRFRQTWIPAVDPALKLGLSAQKKIVARAAIVLHGHEGNWAVLADSVTELSFADQLIPCDIPFLLKVSAMGYYSQVFLLNNEPWVVFDPEDYYGASAQSA